MEGAISKSEFVHMLLEAVVAWESHEEGSCPIHETHRKVSSLRSKLNRLLASFGINDWIHFHKLAHVYADLPDYLKQFVTDDEDNDDAAGDASSCAASPSAASGGLSRA